MDEVVNQYEVLGVEHNATAEEIKKAYRKLALIHHPDKFGAKSPEKQKTLCQELKRAYPCDKEVEEMFQKINEANEILSDKARRDGHDADLAETPATARGAEAQARHADFKINLYVRFSHDGGIETGADTTTFFKEINIPYKMGANPGDTLVEVLFDELPYSREVLRYCSVLFDGSEGHEKSVIGWNEIHEAYDVAPHSRSFSDPHLFGFKGELKNRLCEGESVMVILVVPPLEKLVKMFPYAGDYRIRAPEIYKHLEQASLLNHKQNLWLRAKEIQSVRKILLDARERSWRLRPPLHLLIVKINNYPYEDRTTAGHLLCDDIGEAAREAIFHQSQRELITMPLLRRPTNSNKMSVQSRN